MADQPDVKGTVSGWLIEYVQENGLTLLVTTVVIACILFYILGVVSLWVWKRAAIRASGEKDLAEAMKTRLEVAEKLNASCDAYSNAVDTLNLLLRELHDAVKTGNASKIDLAREEVSRHFGHEQLRALKNLLNLHNAARDSTRNRSAVECEAIRALESAVRFLELVNNPELLSMIGGKSQYLLNRVTLSPVYSFISENLPWWALCRRGKWHCLRNKIKTFEQM